MMPELRSISSPDLENGLLPADPEVCAVLIEVEIGPVGGAGGDLFSFVATTPRALQHEERRWGHGLLILQSFSWQAVESALASLMSHAQGDTWQDVASRLARDLDWEFDDYSQGGHNAPA
jgi:hypothetical protein